MRREQLIQNKASKMIALANAIMQDYKAEGYETQELEVKDDGHGNKGYIVQIRNTSDNAGGFLKKIIGCENCASLILTAKGNNLEIKVAGGKWLDSRHRGIHDCTLAFAYYWYDRGFSPNSSFG